MVLIIRQRYRSILVLCFICGVSKVSGQWKTGHFITGYMQKREVSDKVKNDILQISNDVFSTGIFTGGAPDTIHYRLLTPRTTATQKDYPLVVIFPSSGGIGTDNLNQMRVLPKFWAQDSIRERYPAYVVAIQFPTRSSNYTRIKDSLFTSQPTPCLSTALQLVDSLKQALPVDTNRIYAIGFSMGASTANNAIVARPGLFAASLLISGIPMLENTEALIHTSLWLVHGNDDTENHIQGDRSLYEKMHFYKHPDIAFWEIEGLQHETYPLLYTTDMVPAWLFSRRKGMQQIHR